MRAREAISLFLIAVSSLTACAEGAYVWVQDVSKADVAGAGERDYVIGAGDALAIRVYNQDPLSTRGRVRPDGKISVPLAGEVDALGRRPQDLAKDIEARLKPFVVAPAVFVSVEEVRPIQISMLGEVTRPGVVALDAGAGVLQAIASAGGTTDFADRERIFVLRKREAQPPLRIRFSYAELAQGGGGALFVLAHGDVVIVE